jgi:hypothetical protein
MTDEESRERFEQPHPGSSGHEDAGPEELPEEPEVDEAEDAGEQSEHADQESKHSLPASDPPSNY